MRLLMVDDDGAVMQEYSGVTAQADGHEITGTVLLVRIPGESTNDDQESTS